MNHHQSQAMRERNITNDTSQFMKLLPLLAQANVKTFGGLFVIGNEGSRILILFFFFFSYILVLMRLECFAVCFDTQIYSAPCALSWHTLQTRSGHQLVSKYSTESKYQSLLVKLVLAICDLGYLYWIHGSPYCQKIIDQGKRKSIKTRYHIPQCFTIHILIECLNCLH